MTLVVATSLPEPRRSKAPALPFTLRHFRAWGLDLITDTGDSFKPEDYFEAFLEDVFAGVPECWLLVPEGNGKTTSLSALALYHLEHRGFASVPVAASSREQAELLYRQAEGFVIRSPRLREPVHSEVQAAKGKRKTEVPRFQCLEGYRRINFHAGGRIQVYAADDATGDGVLPTLALVDEPHRMRNLNLYRTWAGKLDKRDGQLATISTRGEPGSDFEETLERIRSEATEVLRRGSFIRASSKRLVLHQWAVPEADDVHDFAAVKRANPFKRITVAGLAAKYKSPTMTEEHWLRFVCNRPHRGSKAAIQDIEWEGAKTTARIPKGEPIWLGLDVAWKWDTTSAVPLWWKSAEHRQLGPATILVPPRDGSSLDAHLVEAELVKIHQRNPVHTVVMDTSKAEQLGAWIAETLGATVIDRAQTNSLAVEDYELFMEALRSGWLKHSGDAGLTRHALNAIAYVLPFGDARFDRPKQGRDSSQQERRVIDALVAAAMVHAIATRRAQEPPKKAAKPWVSLGGRAAA